MRKIVSVLAMAAVLGSSVYGVDTALSSVDNKGVIGEVQLSGGTQKMLGVDLFAVDRATITGATFSYKQFDNNTVQIYKFDAIKGFEMSGNDSVALRIGVLHSITGIDTQLKEYTTKPTIGVSYGAGIAPIVMSGYLADTNNMGAKIEGIVYQSQMGTSVAVGGSIDKIQNEDFESLYLKIGYGF